MYKYVKWKVGDIVEYTGDKVWHSSRLYKIKGIDDVNDGIAILKWIYTTGAGGIERVFLSGMGMHEEIQYVGEGTLDEWERIYRL